MKMIKLTTSYAIFIAISRAFSHDSIRSIRHDITFRKKSDDFFCFCL